MIGRRWGRRSPTTHACADRTHFTGGQREPGEGERQTEGKVQDRLSVAADWPSPEWDLGTLNACVANPWHSISTNGREIPDSRRPKMQPFADFAHSRSRRNFRSQRVQCIHPLNQQI